MRRAIPGVVCAACAVLALSFASACGRTPDAGSAEAPIARVHRARCGSCHVRVEPGERTRAQLEAALAGHRKRVHLSEADWALMVDYLAVRSADDAGAAP